MKFEEFVKVPLNAKFKNSETAEKVFLLINNEKMKVKIA